MIGLSYLRQISTAGGNVGKGILTTATAAVLISLSSRIYFSTDPATPLEMASPDKAASVYEFSYIDIDGKEQSMDKYRGRVLIAVNVATKCGYTQANYEQLSALHEKYKDRGLSVLGFPCTQFMNQEPGTEEEIKNFVCTRFKATFDMAKKIDVNGANAHPLWKYMQKKQGGTLVNMIKWNFTKFLINKQGQVVQRYGPSTNPNDFEQEIVKLLDE